MYLILTIFDTHYTPWLEGQDANEGPQPVVLRHAGVTAAQLKSYRDELRVPDIIGTNIETLVKYLKGVKDRGS